MEHGVRFKGCIAQLACKVERVSACFSVNTLEFGVCLYASCVAAQPKRLQDPEVAIAELRVASCVLRLSCVTLRLCDGHA